MKLNCRRFLIGAWLVGCVARCPLPAQYWSEVRIPAPTDITAGGTFGASVSLEGDLLIAGAPGTASGATSSGAAYVYDRYEGGANAWGFLKKLVPPTPSAQARFGQRVHLSANRAFVSAPGDLNLGVATGAIYIYDRDLGGPDNWGFKQKVVIDTLRSGLRFGSTFLATDSLLVVDCPGYDENTADLAIGAGGLAAFRLNGAGVYTPTRFVTGNELVQPVSIRPCLSGWLAVFNGTLVYTSTALDAYRLPLAPFGTSDGDLSEPQPLQLTDTFGLQSAYLYYGGVVADDEHLLVDVHYDDAAFPFRLVSFVSDGADGVVQTGCMRPDSATAALNTEWWGWGEALDLFHGRAVVGVFGDVFFTPLGHAEVFQADDGSASGWTRVAYLNPSDPHYGDQFGRAASLSDDVIIIGAPMYGDLDKGQVYAFLDPHVGMPVQMPPLSAGLRLGPNPIRRDQGLLCISLDPPLVNGTLVLHEVDGRSVRSIRTNNSTAMVDVSDLHPAPYLISWTPASASEATFTTRFIVLP